MSYIFSNTSFGDFGDLPPATYSVGSTGPIQPEGSVGAMGDPCGKRPPEAYGKNNPRVEANRKLEDELRSRMIRMREDVEALDWKKTQALEREGDKAFAAIEKAEKAYIDFIEKWGATTTDASKAKDIAGCIFARPPNFYGQKGNIGPDGYHGGGLNGAVTSAENIVKAALEKHKKTMVDLIPPEEKERLQAAATPGAAVPPPETPDDSTTLMLIGGGALALLVALGGAFFLLKK